MDMDYLRSDRTAYFRKMLSIALPVMIQNGLALGTNMIDTLMIGRLGEAEMAGVGAANQFFFVFSMFCFGLFSGSAVYVAQYFGVRDYKAIRRVVGIELVTVFAIALATMGAILLFAPGCIWVFSRDSQVIALGSRYLRMVSLSYLFDALSFCLIYNCRAIQRLKEPTIINAVAVVTNLVLNFILIYGKCGMPALGVQGAAIATVVARALELTLILGFICLSRDFPIHGRIREFLSFDRQLVKRVMKTALPVVLTEGSWAIITALIFVAYGMLGYSSLAATQVAAVVSDFVQVVFFGMGNATAFTIGETLGQGKKDLAQHYGATSLQVTFLMCVLVTVFLIVVARPVAEFYKFTPETTELLVMVLIAWALTVTPKMMAYMLICGILRAGGDTLFCLGIDLICNAALQLTGAFGGVLILKLPVYYVVVIIAFADLVKAFVCFARYRSRKWLNTFT